VSELTLSAIVAALGGQLHGNAQLAITGLAPLEVASPSQVSFLSNPRYQQQLAGSKAGCVIVGTGLAEQAIRRGNCIVTDQPYLYFARLTQLWKTNLRAQRAEKSGTAPKIHPSAVVDALATVDCSARIGALCVVERGARIGPGTELKARVTVGEDCVIGARCLLHSGVVIGADGFGFAPDGDRWEKIEQLGAVRIGDDVEIGANTCVDRGALQDTVIEDGVKLDNLIQVGHNVRIGRNTAIAGCAGIAGSATIGARCTIGGGAVVLGHLQIADGVHISAATVVSKSIRTSGHYTGFFPLDDNASWERNAATLKQLHSLRERIKKLESDSPP
jgi:UDP-3-O-[3-hydroxymyristoyl] glucosamine N-acyltransferase